MNLSYLKIKKKLIMKLYMKVKQFLFFSLYRSYDSCARSDFKETVRKTRVLDANFFF